MPTLLEIVAPDRLLLSQPVDMAVIPASEGEMGVLPGHSPMIVLLRGGTITLHEGGRPTSQLYVSGGFAERQDGFGTDEVLNRRETLELVRAYYRITEPAVRKRVFELIKSMGPAEA